MFCVDVQEKLCDDFSPSYQFSKAVPGQRAKLVETAEGFDSIGRPGGLFFVRGLENFAQSVLEFLRTEAPDDQGLMEGFWSEYDYGGLLLKALTSSVQSSCEEDLSDRFLQYHEGKTARFEAEVAHLVGRIEIQFDSWDELDEGHVSLDDGLEQPDVAIKGNKAQVGRLCCFETM